jgi:peptidoglycan/LPS O-acetylase OafA/YrhL
LFGVAGILEPLAPAGPPRDTRGMCVEDDYTEPDLLPRVRGPVERAFRAVALVLVAVVLLAGWVAAVAFALMLSDPMSRRPTSPLWWGLLVGAPLAVSLRFLYRSRPRTAVTVGLLAVWVAGVWAAAVVSSGGLSAHRGSGLWFVPMFGGPLLVFVRSLYRCRRRTRAVPPRV